MKIITKASIVAIAALAFSAGSAHAVTCTTSTPVDSTVVSDAGTVIGGGGTYNAVGTADCPDQPGPQGPQGEPGQDGIDGQDGADGADGVDGQDGAPGPQGVAGVDGQDGQDGVDGQDGAPGAKGDKGDKGDTGAQGIAGLNGLDGQDGAKGDKGDKGDKGEQGIAGVDGKDGKDGKDFDPSEYQEGLATIGALHVPHVENNFAASLSSGFYNDKTAIGIGAGVRFDKTWQFGGSLAVGTNGGDIAGKAALTGQW